MKRLPLLCLALGLAFSTGGFAQQLGLQPLGNVTAGVPRTPAPKPNDSFILLKSGVIDVRAVNPRENAARTADGLRRLGQTANQRTYYLVHTTLPADAALLARFRALGGEPVSLVPRNTWIVRANAPAAAAIDALPEVDLVALYHPVHRIHPALVAKLQGAPGLLRVTVVLFNGEDPDAARAAFTALGATQLSTSTGTYGPRFRMSLPANAVASLANMPGVQWVEEELPRQLFNDAGTGFGTITGIPDGPTPGTPDGLMNVAPVWSQGLDGSGMVVGHADSGLDVGKTDATLHPDFYNAPSRVTGIALGRPAKVLSNQVSYGWTDNQPHQQDAHRFQVNAASVVSQITVLIAIDETTKGLLTCSLWDGD
ncbi:MAG: hypothetical protein QHJ73_05060, partial [Armatimonadota bacterium]|nr:hypothetical protein [Armatimonadota bacterium]